MNSFFPQTLPSKTAQLVDTWQKQKPDFLTHFYLSGGTALSLQLGHRESEDLDFFNQNSFNAQRLQNELFDFGQLEQTQLEVDTLNTYLQGVKLQFLEYPYQLIRPLVNWQAFQLSSIEDIACTKLQTISARGSKKDFIDLYFILQHYSLAELFELMEQKYAEVNYSKTHIMKSLVYFEDAESQPMPRMHHEIAWSDVQATIIEAVKSIRLG